MARISLPRSDFSALCPYRGMINDAADRSGVRPELIEAVIWRESRARNTVGDGGHGHGLMQIDDRVSTHRRWLEGNRNGLDARANIDFGSSIIAANLRMFDGSERAAVAAYNAGPSRVRSAVERGNSPDSVTTGGDYASEVLRLAAQLLRDLRCAD